MNFNYKSGNLFKSRLGKLGPKGRQKVLIGVGKICH